MGGVIGENERPAWPRKQVALASDWAAGLSTLKETGDVMVTPGVPYLNTGGNFAGIRLRLSTVRRRTK
jgi:hypothetical protein